MTDDVSGRLKRFIPAGAALYSAVGCSECSMTGYRGRFSIVEVLTMSPELERRISEGAAAEKIAEAARAGGMRSLFASGLRHVLSGESTLEELLRVTEPPHEDTEKQPASSKRTQSSAAPRVSGPQAALRAEPEPKRVSLEFAMDLLEDPVQIDG